MTLFILRFFQNSFPLYALHLFLLFHLTPCLVVAFQPCMDWIQIKKNTDSEVTLQLTAIFFWTFTEVTRKLQWIVKSATYIGTEKNQWMIHADIHAFTECDITSQFCSIRKGKAFKALMENHVFISVHKNMHVIISNNQDPKTTGQKSGLFSIWLEGKNGNFQIKEKPHC